MNKNKFSVVVVACLIAVVVTGAQASNAFLSVALSPAMQAEGLTPTTGFADPAFERVWQRTDQPVQAGRATDRSWTWGPQGLYSGSEPFAEGPNGMHSIFFHLPAPPENPRLGSSSLRFGNHARPDVAEAEAGPRELVVRSQFHGLFSDFDGLIDASEFHQGHLECVPGVEEFRIEFRTAPVFVCSRLQLT